MDNLEQLSHWMGKLAESMTAVAAVTRVLNDNPGSVPEQAVRGIFADAANVGTAFADACDDMWQSFTRAALHTPAMGVTLNRQEGQTHDTEAEDLDAEEDLCIACAFPGGTHDTDCLIGHRHPAVLAFARRGVPSL